MTIKAVFRVGTLKLRGDAQRLETAVRRLRQDVALAEERRRAVERGIKRMYDLLARTVETALTTEAFGG